MTPGTRSLLDTMMTELHSLEGQPEAQKEQIIKINKLLKEEGFPAQSALSMGLNDALNNLKSCHADICYCREYQDSDISICPHYK